MKKFFSAVSTVFLIIAICLSWMASGWAAEVDGSKTAIPEQARALLRVGVSTFQAGDYRLAVEQFTEAISANSAYAAAYSNRCLARIHLEAYLAATEDCTQALQLNPSDTEAYLNRGLAYYRLGKSADAIADYNQLLQLKPHDFRAYYNRGLAQAEQQAYRAAIVDYGEALRQVSPLDHATLAEIHNDRGLAYLWLERWPQAIEDFTQAVQFNKIDVRAYYNRGCAQHHQGNLTAALNDFSQVLRFAPTYAQAYLSRGLIQQQLGNREAALADLQHAAQFFQTQGATVAYQQTLNLIEKIQGFSLAIG